PHGKPRSCWVRSRAVARHSSRTAATCRCRSRISPLPHATAPSPGGSPWSGSARTTRARSTSRSTGTTNRSSRPVSPRAWAGATPSADAGACGAAGSPASRARHEGKPAAARYRSSSLRPISTAAVSAPDSTSARNRSERSWLILPAGCPFASSTTRAASSAYAHESAPYGRVMSTSLYRSPAAYSVSAAWRAERPSWSWATSATSAGTSKVTAVMSTTYPPYAAADTQADPTVTETDAGAGPANEKKPHVKAYFLGGLAMPEFAVAPPEPAVVDRIARAAIENAIWLLKELPLDLTGPLKAEIAEHGRPACDPHALMGAVWQRIKNSE